MTRSQRVAVVALGIALSGVAGPVASGQTSRSDPTDLQAWYATGVKVNLPGAWEGTLKVRGRRIGDASTYYGTYVTTDLGYRFADAFAGTVSYRLARVEGGTYHRAAMGGELSRDMGRTTLSWRNLFQVQRRNFADNDEGDTKSMLRSRLEMQRRMTDAVDLYVSTEPYFKVGGGSGTTDYLVDNWRNTAGLKFEFADGKKLDLFYIYRPDYAKSYNRTFHVVGVDLMFDVKLGGKK
jgi:hypothetical protein